MHARPKGVEDASYTHFHAALFLIGVAHGLGNALALIIASTRAVRIDIAKVRLRLRVDLHAEIRVRGELRTKEGKMVLEQRAEQMEEGSPWDHHRLRKWRPATGELRHALPNPAC